MNVYQDEDLLYSLELIGNEKCDIVRIIREDKSTYYNIREEDKELFHNIYTEIYEANVKSDIK